MTLVLLTYYYLPYSGLVHFLKSGNKRVEKFGEIKRAADLQEHKLRHYRQLQNLLSEKDRAQFIEDWNPEEFYLAMQEVKQKRANLLPEVARELDFQPFIKNSAFKYDTSMVIPEDLESSSTLRMKLPTCPLSFDPYFLRRVHACLLSVARPEDIFDVEHIQSVDSTDTLFTRIQNFKEREICQNCGTKCYLYCADCGGLRMPKASQVLPSRINLEHFNILIVLHWQEKVSKSTGVAAAVMALEGQVKIVNWPRSEREWAHDYLEYKDKMAKQVDVVLDEINCESDYLLFPGVGSVDAASVDWSTVPLDMAVKSSDEASLQAPSMPRKRRLIVIESSWATGKTVYNDLLLGLNAKYGPEMASKLKCISLSNIVGQYWRFQAVGHSAVSTIEAIYHAAMVAKNCSREMTAEQASVPSKSVQCSDANNVSEAKTSESTVSCDEPYDALLILFRLQRNRILTDLRSKDRGLPRAMRVSGSGIGDWAIVLNSYGMSLKGQVDD